MVALIATFVYSQWRTERLLAEQVLAQARAFTQVVVATRQYVAEHGGVYVPLSDAAPPNPYLEAMPGLRTRMTDESGTVYVLRNPALVTRMVSEELAGIPGARVSFHLASDAPINPDNLADDFETEALRLFGEGAEEHSAFAGAGEGATFRYAAPLTVKGECLRCHVAQGWEVGQVRGALSVSVGAAGVTGAITDGRKLTGLFLGGSLLTLLAALFAISTRLLDNLLKAESALRELATHDTLTGLLNRRAAIRRLSDETDRSDREGVPLSVAMLDLDHFKRVNDTAGHAAGDAVLVAAARGLNGAARVYDTVARLGGEEFLLVMPGVGSVEAAAVVERFRAEVAAMTAAAPEWEGPVTVSAGVAVRTPGSGEHGGDVLRRADRALYAAKDRGRDRTVIG